ncbi:hypothetical protein APUTEX25_004684 [Auxenochlorella protothecoides]|uniref:Uncharacterized protein n=1 Tax=Auxenochlorella protothecoides TaxID=3075 RepID=A0A3M7L128_AUXPR|nr:hypothetical protein APUTEX25_004684 [Auxenochlorella protothecoides]|eukprot:RMZ56461.1 hypothetical protein APUTEX25_004684 [Auxenochlorella protothecoides]
MVQRRREMFLAAEEALEADSRRFAQHLQEDAAATKAALAAVAEASDRHQPAEMAVSSWNRQVAAAEAGRLEHLTQDARAGLERLQERLAEANRHGGGGGEDDHHLHTQSQAFLDATTPSTHFAAFAARQAAERARREAAWASECEAVEKARQHARHELQLAEQAVAGAFTHQEYTAGLAALRAARAATEAAGAARPPPAPDHADLDGEQAPMVHTAPEQLLALLRDGQRRGLQAASGAAAAATALHAARRDAEEEGREDLRTTAALAERLAWAERCLAEAELREAELARAVLALDAPRAGAEGMEAAAVPWALQDALRLCGLGEAPGGACALDLLQQIEVLG